MNHRGWGNSVDLKALKYKQIANVFAITPPYISPHICLGYYGLPRLREFYLLHWFWNLQFFWLIYFFSSSLSLKRRSMLKNQLKSETLKPLLYPHLSCPCSQASHSALAESEIQLKEMPSCINLAQKFPMKIWFLIIWPATFKEKFYQQGFAWKFFALIVKNIKYLEKS